MVLKYSEIHACLLSIGLTRLFYVSEYESGGMEKDKQRGRDTER